MTVKEIFEDAVDQMATANDMIITEIADETYVVEDIEYLLPQIEELKSEFEILIESLTEELVKIWIGDLDEQHN